MLVFRKNYADERFMKAVIIYPPGLLEDRDISRAVKICEDRFPTVGQVELAYVSDIGLPSENKSDFAAKPIDLTALITDWDIIVLLEDINWQTAAPVVSQLQLSAASPQRVYKLRNGVHLELIFPEKLDTVEFPSLNQNVFARLSAGQRGHVNFPFSPMFIDTGVTTPNQFGFRTKHDFAALEARPKEHKVIAAFGGSACFSYYCLDDEVFSTKLENMLNSQSKSADDGQQYTVVNFGRHDAITMNEIIIYLNFAQNLKPEYVVAHDGHNDLYYGLQSDPELFNKFGFAYQRNLEEWSKILHGSADLETPKMYSIATDVQQMNFCDQVVNAYINRKHQFQKIVTAHGSEFIWSLQPVHTSKSKLTEYEKKKYQWTNTSGIYHEPEFKKFMRFLYFSYDAVSNRLAQEHRIESLDFHQIFKKEDQDKDFFWDHCHLSPEGDEVLAKHLFKKIRLMEKKKSDIATGN